MLQYAYKHKGGEHNALVRAPPTDPNGYSHQHLWDIGIETGYRNSLVRYITLENVCHLKMGKGSEILLYVVQP